MNGYEHQTAHCVRVVEKRLHPYQRDQIPHYSLPTVHNQFTINSRSIHDQFTYPYPTLDLIFEYRGSFGINHMNCTGWVLRRNQLFQERLLLTSSYYANCLDVKTEGREVYTPRSHWQDLTQ